MKIKKNDSSLDPIIQKDKMTTNLRLKLVAFIVLYILLILIQNRYSYLVGVNGVLSQIQVVLSISMVMQLNRPGYISAVLLNIFQFFSITFFVISTYSYGAVPGIIIPLGTIIIIIIISNYKKHMVLYLTEVTEQQNEIRALYNYSIVAKKRLSEQNNELIELNNLMKTNEEKLNYLAFFDLLTELPNRKMIVNRLDLLIHLSTHQPFPFALVIIDIDEFKRVNDSLGHATGDLLLTAVASKLNNLVHPDDMLGRLGGDEFAIIVKSELRDKELFLYLETFKNALQDVFTINQTQLTISASFGVSRFPSHGTTTVELLKCSDTALYKSKSQGKNNIQFFKRDMEVEVLKNIEFEKRLLSAIDNNEMYLVFQPQYTTAAKKLSGFETLIRWNSPELGFINPIRLISVAEEIGYIIPLGKWILKTACTIFMDLLSTYPLDIVLSVNISAVQLVDKDFIQMVADVLEETGLDGEKLQLEVTESVLITSLDYVIDVLTSLKQMGITIALDDFGTGYSSLSYLQLLPIDRLKIDKSFIYRLVDTPTTNHLTGAIISLVHQMGMKVVAEGVETEFQLAYLKENKCDYIQGYLWNKPLVIDDVRLLLAEQ